MTGLNIWSNSLNLLYRRNWKGTIPHTCAPIQNWRTSWPISCSFCCYGNLTTSFSSLPNISPRFLPPCRPWLPTWRPTLRHRFPPVEPTLRSTSWGPPPVKHYWKLVHVYLKFYFHFHFQENAWPSLGWINVFKELVYMKLTHFFFCLCYLQWQSFQ